MKALAKNNILKIFIGVSVILKASGLMWGVNPYPGTKLEWFEHDEREYIRRTVEIALKKYTPCYHTLGFSTQVAVLAKLLHIKPLSIKKNLILGRVLALVYGLSLLGIIFLICVNIWGEKEAIYSVIIAGGFPLLNIYSHLSLANIGNTFYLYLIIYLTILFRTKALIFIHIFILSICTALGLSMTGNLVILIPPLLLIAMQNRRKVLYSLIIYFLFTSLFFYVVNGLYLRMQDIQLIMKNFQKDLLNVIPDHKDIYNLIVIPLSIIVSVTLPLFILGIKGLKTFISGSQTLFSKICITLPVTVYTTSLFLIDVPFDRYLLPLLPFWAMLGGLIISRLKSFKIPFVVILYLYIGAVGIEYNFWHENRQKAFYWITSHIPPGTEIYLNRYFKPSEFYYLYRVSPSITGADYIILHERYYRRYIRSISHPFDSTPYHIYHKIGQDRIPIQRIFMNKGPYRIIKRFHTISLLPEHIIRKYTLGSYPDIIGDVIVAQKVNPE
ncbi:MAG: hypothetical protein B6D53_00710 [Candidatus Omnitrophica bacterium 4484_49]|nr:MAG: hypothetical protein B6D53_00710 [Candidatus Omnitrophica bacterium 4484_49]